MAELEGWEDRNARALFAYERLMARGVPAGSMQWHVPSLALVAQAFLLPFALRPGIAPLSATIVSIVGLLITLLALQLMARHHWFSHLDRLDMRDIERSLDLLPISDRTSQEARHPGERPPWLAGLDSFRCWRAGLVLIAFVDVGIGLDAWFPARWVVAGLGVGLLAMEGFVLLASLLIPVRR